MGSIFSVPLFHLGPMSLQVVNAALAVAERRRMPLCLIASRRQIDAAALGGGYVNNWTTEAFADYVRANDRQGLITMARDHGGPYQHDEDKNMPLQDAMVAALKSYETDILAGFKILHLDPEKAVTRGAADALQQFTELTVKLMLAVDSFAKANGIKDVQFEIGTDEGVGEDFTVADWASFVNKVMSSAADAGATLPTSLAVPMGTKVKEMRNTGGLIAGNQAMRTEWFAKLEGLKAIAKSHNLILKLHNADYLSASAVAEMARFGVRCINVAPELGVVETRTLLNVLRENGLTTLAEEFLEFAHASGRWQRWLVQGTSASDVEKSYIAGHYVFAAPEMMALRQSAQKVLAMKDIQLDTRLQHEIEKTIDHYLNAMESSYASQAA